MLNVIDDMINYKCKRKIHEVAKKKKYNNPVKVVYVNPAVEEINLNSILKKKDIQE